MKKIISALLLVFMLLSLSACHGKVDMEKFVLPEEFDTSRDYEISFWAKNDTNITQVNIYKQAIEDFQKLYPNIKVNLRLYTDYGKIYNDVLTNIGTNTPPNVCITYPDHIAAYLTGEDVVVPLKDLFGDEKYGLGGSEVPFDAPALNEIVPQFLAECEFNGDYYAIPFMRSTEACYVNKTYVEKLGYELPEQLTWDFIWEVSEAATKKDEDGNYIVNGQKTLIPFIYKSTDNMMISALKQQEAGYSTSKGEIQLFNDTTTDFLKTVNEHSQIGAFNTFKLIGYPANFLNAGQCIFAIDSTAGATWMGCNAPLMDISEDRLVEFETEVMTIPQYNPASPKMISQGPSMCIFNSEDSQAVLASWLFAQYMLTNEVQIAYSQTEGYVPVTQKAQKSVEYTDYLSRIGEDNQLYYDVKIKAAQLLLDNVDNTFVTPVFNGSADLRNAAGQLIEDVNKAAYRKKTVDDEYIQKLYKETTSLYRLDQIAVSQGDEGSVNVKINFDGLPIGAVILLCALAFTWVCIGIYVAVDKKKSKKN